MQHPRSVILLLAIGIATLCGSCSAYFHQPLTQREARIGERPPTSSLLENLPTPREPIYAAVYKFRDQTGQYKPSDIGANWSTAVTQGATNILIQALDKSKWFVPIERENVSNLLNERKIIRSSRSQYQGQGEQQALLPPLLFAGVLLEGGIVSYDANMMTGGFGARYFGVGGSTQYRQDRVTVYLRAVSTTSGKILKTVYTSKTLLSQAVDVGLFRYVRFQRLLESETGFTYNEPSEMAVSEAIEKAVQVLILEGIKDNLWYPDSTATRETNLALAAYEQEVATMAQTDINGRTIWPHQTEASLTIAANGIIYQGDLPRGSVRPGAEITFNWHFDRNWFLNLGAGYFQMGSQERFEANYGLAELNLGLRLLPQDRFSPFAYGGIGAISKFAAGNENTELPPAENVLKLQVGFGLDFALGKNIAIMGGFSYNYFLDDMADGTKVGQYNDIYLQGRLGFRYYFPQP